ncbi:RluA family pseudouridine synthase [Parablautia intestinalis]|uniref:RNA pseudouridylate synthase n=2 Tax=Parablautia intestinalis TaxID=2320100 RepID=A0A3A9AKU8_9FIRM|nr:RluA family pseudouridine synthase [Parablautia intestinalis]
MGVNMKKNIIYEDKHIIIVYKPAGIATQTARVSQQDMVSELKNYLAKKPEYKDKKEPYLGLVHRLDQPVSGLLVFSKTRQASGELSRQITNGQLQKYYYAVVYGKPQHKHGTLTDYICKDPKTNLSLVVKEDFPQAKKAVLEYKFIKTLLAFDENADLEKFEEVSHFGEVSLVEINLITGRHHQIRAQMSHAGMPLLGDAKYGSDLSKELSRKTGCKDIALCAYKLTFFHPVSGKKVTFEKHPEGEIFFPFFSSVI